MYELYSATSLPFALETNSDQSAHGIIASYKLETTTFAIDTHRTKYIFLSPTEMETCLHGQGEFCSLHKAAYAVEYSQACVIALFTKNNLKVSRYCEIIVNPNIFLPKAVYLDDGNYAIASDRETKLQVTCHRDVPTAGSLIVKPPVQVIQLQLTCMAYNERITLLPYFHSQTKYRPKHDPFSGLLDSANFSLINIWTPFRKMLPNYSHADLPDTLQKIDNVPMSDFISKIRNGREVRIETDYHGKPFPFWAKLAIIVGSALLLFIIILRFKDLITTCIIKKCLGVEKSSKAENHRTTPTHDGPPTVVRADDETGPERCDSPSVDRPIERPKDLPIHEEPVSFMTVIDQKLPRD